MPHTAFLILAAILLSGCGSRQLAVLGNRSLAPSHTPVTLYVSEVDMTGHQQLYEVASFIDTLVPRLAGSQVEYRKHYKNSQTNKMDFYLEFYKNPFMVTADSTEADLIATIRISLMDYVKEKDIRSTGEAVSRYLAMGIFSLLGGNERVGVFGADCQVTERSSGSMVYGFSFGGLSPTGLDRRQALRSATHRSVELFIKGLFRKQ